MKKYKVGDTVHVIECGNLRRRSGIVEHYDSNITKVGRKYFYLNVGYGDDVAFNIDNGRHKTEYCENFRIVESEKIYLEETEVKKINEMIRNNFSHYGRCKFSLTQLKAVAEILELEG